MGLNNRYSLTNNAWLTPTAILDARLMKVEAQIQF